jgi:hypothetical protein
MMGVVNGEYDCLVSGQDGAGQRRSGAAGRQAPPWQQQNGVRVVVHYNQSTGQPCGESAAGFPAWPIKGDLMDTGH